MAFLVLLITLGCYKLFGLRVSREYDQWFYALAGALAAPFKAYPSLAMLFTLLLPVALVGMALALLEDALFGLMGVALHVVILFYSFGRDNLLQTTEAYLKHWNEGDVQSAYHHAEEHFRVEQAFDAEDLSSMQQAVRKGILYQWFEQVFVVLFWYLLAGPLVALFIRLTCLYNSWLQESEVDGQAPLQLLHAMEWLPARLLGFTFTVAGNFAACFKTWTEAVLSWNMPTEKVLNNAGLAALGVCVVEVADGPTFEPVNAIGDIKEEYADEVEKVQDLVVRSLVVWVVMVAILAIA